MEQRKNLCAQVPLSLHTQVMEAREALGLIEDALEVAEQQLREETSGEAGVVPCETPADQDKSQAPGGG